MRNPKWHRDEIILALNLYLDPYRGSIDSRNPNIIELSNLLNMLPFFEVKPDSEKFRNPNGVSLKMSNFLALDPKYHGRGMSSYSKQDKKIFDEFYNDRQRLIKISNAIKGIAQNEKLNSELKYIENDEESILDFVQEGQVLYRLHKYRERNSKIVNFKKKDILQKTGELRCEVCNFSFESEFGELGKGFIECHHIKPISTYDSSLTTQIEDLALVCSNCHRMLHRNISSLSINDLKEIKIATKQINS